VNGSSVGQLGDTTVVATVNQTGTTGFNFHYTSQTNKFGGAILVMPAGQELSVNVNPLVFQVGGVTKIVVSVSDDLVVGTNPDGTPRYRSVNITYDLSTGQ